MANSYPAALFLPADAYDTENHQVIGRRIAGRLLVQGVVRYLMPEETLHLVAPGATGSSPLAGLITSVLPKGASVQLHPAPSRALAEKVGVMYRPDPAITSWAALRAGGPSSDCSLVGVIHTLCSEAVLRSLSALVTADLHPWDALVCTSTAGRAVVEEAIAATVESLRRRFGAPSLAPAGLPLLPVIPLAIDPAQPFAPQDSRDQRRRRAREAMGIDAADFVVASVGRLSFHSKAHPLALYGALDRLAHRHPQVHLLECGHLFNAAIGEAYQQARGTFTNLRVSQVGGLQVATEEQKWQVLAAADVFVSPADSIQETFGLSLLEAMAAELPVVATDWNGYRDLVEDGVSGLLIPCADVMAGLGDVDHIGIDHSLGMINYDMMLALRSLGVVIDADALEAALERLLLQPDLAREMGASGRERLIRRFSWQAVAGQYRELWAELQQRRQHGAATAPEGKPEFDYGRLFSGYPTAPLRPERIQLLDEVRCAQLAPLKMALPLLAKMPGLSMEGLLPLLAGNGTLEAAQLAELGLDPDQVAYVLAALLKFGLATAA